jgi:putative ABC transport system permease protein
MSRSSLDRSSAARRAVVRWAYRLVRRDWRQYTVIVALLTIAVAASTFVISAAYNIAPAAGDAEFGDASSQLYLEGEHVTAADIDDWVAAGLQAFGTVDPIGHREVAVPGTTRSLDVRAQAIGGPYSAPMLVLRDGRAPTAGDEAAVTDGVADMLGLRLGIGDTIDLGGTPRRVVGMVENPNNLDDEFVLISPTEISTSESVSMLFDGSEQQLRQFGDIVGPIRLGERAAIAEDVLAGVLMLLATAVVLLLVSLIATASFTVIGQRRIPHYGMLSAIGGSERHIRLTVLATGALTGIAAATVGGLTGIGAWFALSPMMESLVDHRIAVTNVPWLLVLAGMGLAVLAATAAAWWPARTMSRIPTVAALSGRTPKQARSHRSSLLAIALTIGGAISLRFGSDFGDGGPDALQTVLLVGGTLAVLVGVLLLCPVLIRTLGRMAPRLPISGRLALRDLTRHQARSSAALAAVGLALGIPAVIVASVASGENASPLSNLADNQILVHALEIDGPFAPEAARIAEVQPGVDALAAALGDPQVVRLDTFLDPTTPPEPKSGESLTLSIARKVSDGWMHIGTVYAATPELLAALDFDPSETESDEVVTSVDGELYLFGAGGFIDPTHRTADPLASTGTLPSTYTSLPQALLDPAKADPDWTVAPSGQWLIETERPLTSAELETARQIAARDGFRIETRDDRSDLGMIRLVTGLIGMVLALGVLAATLGLIRGESANDLRTLTAAGAQPSTRRAIAAVTAGALAALGAALGIASAYIGLSAARVDHLMPLPWADLAIIAVGTPLLATLVAWLLAGREPTMISRRPLD